MAFPAAALTRRKDTRVIRCGRMSFHPHLPEPGQSLQIAHSVTAVHKASEPNGAPEPTPFLKWAGGKRRLLRDYEPHFPARADGYHEPFLGSGAVFLRARTRLRPQRMLLSDRNAGLVNAYRAVRDSTERLIDLLEQHHRLHGRKHYYAVRALHSSDLNRIEQFMRGLPGLPGLARKRRLGAGFQRFTRISIGRGLAGFGHQNGHRLVQGSATCPMRILGLEGGSGA